MTVTTNMACITCNREVKEAIYDSTFYPSLFTIMSAFIAVTVIVIILSFISAKGQASSRLDDPNYLTTTPVETASMILGIGLGGFIDGILLHQILQWHEMLSYRIPPISVVAKSVNMFWDGIFHAFTLMATVTGIIMFWKSMRRKDTNKSGFLLAGGMMKGWAIFNIVEGLIDHHLLKLHNVKEFSNSPEGWNFGFLGISVVLLIAGILTSRRASMHHSPKQTI